MSHYSVNPVAVILMYELETVSTTQNNITSREQEINTTGKTNIR
mgnify:CR=1 FL=1